MWQYFTILTVALLTVPTSGTPHNMQLIVEFKELDYAFPTTADETTAINNKWLVRGNGVPIDVDVFYNKLNKLRTIFVSVPKFTTGIPFSFGYITYDNYLKPRIAPYPDYSWHSSQGTNCSQITSVFRVAIDECNRIYILDTGMIGSTQMCPPQLLVFDLLTNKLVRRHKFPTSLYKAGVSLFITLIPDVRDPGICKNVMVYIADVTGFGIIIYDYNLDKSWRAQNKLLYPCAEYGTFNIAGQTFDFMDGVFGLSVSPRFVPYSNRVLFFHSLAGYDENFVPLSVLDNQTMWVNNVDASPRSFVRLGTRGTQSAAEAMDSNGNLYFGLVDQIAIGCWDIKVPNSYNKSYINVVAQNSTTLQFPSGVKVVKNTLDVEELWVSTCRFQRIMTGTKNSNEVNYRIQGEYISTLLDGKTSCNPYQ